MQTGPDRGARRRFVSAGDQMAEDDLIVMEKARASSGRSDNRCHLIKRPDGRRRAVENRFLSAAIRMAGGCQRQHNRPPKNSRMRVRFLASPIPAAVIRHSGLQMPHRSPSEWRPAANSRLSSCPQEVGRPWPAARCISCLSLSFDLETTKHRRNVKSRDPQS